MVYPKQPDLLRGWQLDFEFLKEVKAAIKSKTSEKISLEAVEDVLLAAEEVTKKRGLIQ
jgi:hypothetical protein